MSRRLLLPLGVAVTALLAVAALATAGRPLGGGGRGSGPTPTFFDYAFTTFLVVGVAIAATVIVALITTKPDANRRKRGRFRLVGLLLYLAMAGLLAWAISSSSFQKRLQHAERAHPINSQKTPKVRKGTVAKHGHGRDVRIRWDEIAIVLALLGAAGVAAFASSRRRRLPVTSWRLASRESLSVALDESLDDLRAEPDLRKAIVAAYARMERALAAAGLPRRPSEAPFEYVERALVELDASAGAARRLTSLFEWAKFSQHEPEPQMRDEAIDALVAVRDELRTPAAERAAA
ncbi:MAG TPA: DUF4129 domain-containing protein [Gaiellaceae bacterium]|nr:DUF4129 domain-containing protein [Gaiellaceae bacterium]